jgi:catechol 2,3-dioxygenase-like lactoylglutathione lyase family enzyme
MLAVRSAVLCFGQEEHAMIRPMPRLDAVGLIVADLPASLDFYRRLGLEFPEDADPEGHGHVEATLPGGIRFMLDTVAVIRSFDPDWTEPTGGHRMDVAFLCDSPDAVDRVYAELVESGAGSHKEPWDAFWGQRYAQVKDPDGNVVNLFAPLEPAAG